MAVNLTPSLAAGLGAAPTDKAHLRAWLEGIVAAINSDLDPRATPLYASRASAVSTAPSLPLSLTHIAVREGTALVIRSRTATADDPLFTTAPQWGVVQRQDVAAETTARINATRDTGVLPLANVAGTANAITADIAPAVPGVTLSALSTVELIPSANNTGAVTLNVGGAGAWPVERRDGSAVQAGDIRADVSCLLRRRGSSWRMVNQAESEAQARVDAEAAARAGGDTAIRKDLDDGLWVAGSRIYQAEREYWGSWNANFADPAFDIATAWGVGVSALTSTVTFWRPAALASRLRTVRLFAAKAGTVWVFVRKPGTTAGTYVLKREIALTVVAGRNVIDLTSQGLTLEPGEVLGFRQQSGILYNRAGQQSDLYTADHEGWWIGSSGSPTAAETPPATPALAEDWSIQIELQLADVSNAPGRPRLVLPDDQIMIHWMMGAQYAAGSTVAESGAVASVENSVTFPQPGSAGTIDRRPMQPTSSATASYVGTSVGGGDNAMFHMIRAYNDLIRQDLKVDPASIDHVIVPRMFGNPNGTDQGNLPTLLGSFASGSLHDQYTARVERIKRTKRLSHVLIDATGERDHVPSFSVYRGAMLGLQATFRDFISALRSRFQVYTPSPDPRGRDLVASVQIATASVSRAIDLVRMEAAAANPDHIVAGALYPYFPTLEGNNRRLTQSGQKALGALLGLMLYTVKARREAWVPMQALSVSVRGGTIRIRYPHPVAIDTSVFPLVGAGAGWQLRSPAGAISQMISAVADGNDLVLTTVAPVAAGWVLEYGNQVLTADTWLRGGNIREKTTRFSYDGKPVYRWGLLQDVVLPAPVEDFVTLTQAQYDALSSYAPNTTYQIKA